MSITTAVHTDTAAEMAAVLRRSGLTVPQLAFKTGFSPARLCSALSVDGADPADVRRVREVLEAAADPRGPGHSGAVFRA